MRRYLLEKIDLFAERRLRHHGSGAPPLEVKRPPVGTRSGRYQVVAIGSSTGGPEALARLLPSLKKNLGIPVLVVQHLPQGMTNYFAASLAKKCEYDVREASDGEPVVGGTVYIAPGGLFQTRAGGGGYLDAVRTILFPGVHPRQLLTKTTRIM